MDQEFLVSLYDQNYVPEMPNDGQQAKAWISGAKDWNFFKNDEKSA